MTRRYVRTKFKTEAERFWSKVRQEGDCWIWQNATNNKGYGLFARAPVLGRRSAPLILAHRWAYEAMISEIPAGLELDHLCRNPPCVNPYHADPVTHEVNCRRGTAGEVNGRRERAKTHCPQNHEYTPENTYSQGNDGRGCRECSRISTREWRRGQKHKPSDSDGLFLRDDPDLDDRIGGAVVVGLEAN